jgi:hypothetical protein
MCQSYELEPYDCSTHWQAHSSNCAAGLSIGPGFRPRFEFAITADLAVLPVRLAQLAGIQETLLSLVRMI